MRFSLRYFWTMCSVFCATFSTALAEEVYTFSTTPKHLTDMRLHPSTGPGEAEVQCGHSCRLGLVKGLSVGFEPGIRFFTQPIVSIFSPNNIQHFGGVVGYQALKNLDNTFNADVFLGYRYVRFKIAEDTTRKITSQGLTFGLGFSQNISPIYNQGLVFRGWAHDASTYNDEDALYVNSDHLLDAQNAVEKISKYTQMYPTVELRMPADIEIVNWKASHIDLPNDLHLFLRVEPFFIQNQVFFDKGYAWTEKNFGLHIAGIFAYESVAVDKASRFALSGGPGIDFSNSQRKFDAGGKEDNLEFSLPRRAIIDYSLISNITLSYQF